MAFEKYKHILKEAAIILPKRCLVILLADRGFDDNDFFCAARDLGWGFRIRLKKSLRVYRVSKPCLSLGRLMPARGHALFLHKVWLADRLFGPIHLALAHFKYLLPFFWLEPGPDPCPALASKRQAAKPVATLFALRLEIT